MQSMKFSLKTQYVCLSLMIVGICFTHLFSGCSGSEEEVELTKRETDSIMTYTVLQESFGFYRKALQHNQAGDSKEAVDDFERSLKKLKNVNLVLLKDPLYYNWKKDYEELATAVVQDFLITQSEIPTSSLVFEFASKLPVTYEKIEHKKLEREPLPEGKEVPFERNSAVDSYIEFFSNTDRGRSFVDKCMYRGGKYFPLMRNILKENNAPEELIYLSVQESGLNPTIVSRAGAVGLWQFMPATGNAYGLYQDGYRDDRRDFEKATDAAARHLKDLYKSFDDWYLAFAAYNAGPGRVRKAMSRSGSRDFWTIRSFLPGETKNYVPSIIALSYVLRNPEEYGFNDLELAEQITFDRVEIRANLSLQRVAELCNSDVETIRELNPELTNDEIPIYDVSYHLRIPHGTFQTFAANYKSAGDFQKGSSEPQYAGNEYSETGGIAGIEYKVNGYEVEDRSRVGSTSDKVMVEHDVLKTQNFFWISNYYDVRTVDIRLWNNITYGGQLEPNKKVKIFLTHSRYEKLFGSGKSGNRGNDLADANNQPVEVTKVTGAEVSTSSDTQSEISDSDDRQNYEPEPPEQIKSYYASSDENDSDAGTDETEETVQTETQSSEQSDQPLVSENQTSNTESPATEEVEAEYEETVVNTVKTSTAESKGKGKSMSYVVKEGDNLTTIGAAYGVTATEIMSWNGLSSDKILVGQKLKIWSEKSSNQQVSGSNVSVHTVKKGETMASIAGKYGITVSQLRDWNNLKSDKIVVGQTLKVKGEAPKKVRKKK